MVILAAIMMCMAVGRINLCMALKHSMPHNSRYRPPPSTLSLIMLVNDRAENFEADLFLRQRSIAGYATEAKG